MIRCRHVFLLALVPLLVAVLAACGTAPPAPTPPKTTQTINVTPSQNLDTVAGNAPSGATLALADGSYTLAKTLTVAKDLTLEGSASGKVTVTFDGVSSAAVKGSGLQPAATVPASVVSVAKGTLTAQNVTFVYTGSAAGDVLVASGTAKLDITNCSFEGAVKGTGNLYYIGNGIRMFENATATITGSTFTDNGNAGLAADGNNTVDVSKSTFDKNGTGAIFYDTASGPVKGSTFSHNTGSGIWMGSAGSTGPTPALDGNTLEANGTSGLAYDNAAGGTASNNILSGNAQQGIIVGGQAHPTLGGNTIQNNGSDGIYYYGSSAGTASNNTISGNAQKGVRVVDSAAPTLDGNDIHGNSDDGIAYESSATGTAKGNKIYDNGSLAAGSKGIRVVGSAHPDLIANQVTSNKTEGISFGDTSTGTVSGNTISGNSANGLTIFGQATPSASDNTIQDNGNCGILLQDSADPTLTNNTVSGNANDVCDQRTSPPATPIANQCPTSDNSLNPDPSHDLAVVVEDASGTPVSNTTVDVELFGSSGGWAFGGLARTDANGVAVVGSTTADSWVTSGTYSGTVAVNGFGGAAITPFQIACGNIAFPGTVSATAKQSSLSTVTFAVSHGGTPVPSLGVELGYPYGGRAMLVSGFALGGPFSLDTPDAGYEAVLMAQTATASYQIYQPLTVNGAITDSVDLSQQPVYHLTVDAVDGGGNPVTSQAASFFRTNDAAVFQSTAFGLFGRDFYLTPGTYRMIESLYLQISSTETWSYDFVRAQFDAGTNGGSSTLTVGGALSAGVASDKSSYTAGDTVRITPTVTDPQGSELQGLAVLAGPAPSMASASSGSAQQLQPLGAPARPAGTVAPLAINANTPVITVKDPSGSIVYQTANTQRTYPETESFTLGASAPSGTYTVGFSWNVGPYQGSSVTAASTFQVK